MKKYFPEMYDSPEKGTHFVGIFYWLVCYMMIPFVTTLVVYDSWNDLKVVSWVDLAVYLLNFIVMVTVFGKYLADSVLNVQINKKGFLKTALPTALVVFLIEARLLLWGIDFGWSATLWVYPVSETSVLLQTGAIVLKNPVFGILAMTVLTPLTVSCMFYAAVFAPLCCKNPAVAYPVTALMLLLPRLFNGWWLDGWSYELWIYALQLPIHLIACWSYQKTDTVWTPITVLSISNLLMCLLLLLLQYGGYIMVR